MALQAAAEVRGTDPALATTRDEDVDVERITGGLTAANTNGVTAAHNHRYWIQLEPP